MRKNEKSRTIYAIKNLIFNFGYQVVNTITNVILPPLIITKYGSIVNGLISTVKQIINYIQIVGAGISESVVVSLYKPLQEQDDSKVSAIYNASRITFKHSGIIFSILAVIIAFISPIFITEDLSYDFIVKIVLVLSITGMAEFFFIGKYRTLLIADQRSYVVNIAQIIMAVLSTALTIILIKINTNIVIVQLIATLIYTTRFIILNIYVKRKYDYIDKKVKPDYTAVSKRKAAMTHQIAGLIILGSQALFIAKFCGLAEASVYSVYNLIFSGINTILSTVSSAMLAGVGNLVSSENEEKVNKVYNVYEFIYYILTFIVYTTTFIMCIPFIRIYTGNITDANYIRFDLVILFAIMGLLNCLRTPGVTMINAKGHYEETKNRALIEMTICLVGQVILIKPLGIIGVLLATIMAHLYRTLDVIIYSNKKILKQKFNTTIIRISVNAIIMSILIAISQKIKFNVNGYMQWCLVATGVVIITATIIILINYILDNKTAKETNTYIKNIVKRKKK